MDFNDLINGGWGRHDKDSAALAADLEAHAALAGTPEQAAQFVQLAAHTIGEHLGDWPRARALAERVMQDREDAPALASPLGLLAVTQFAAGDAAAGLATESRAAALSDEPLSALVRVLVLTASALIGSKRLAEGSALYAAALKLARTQEGKLACDRALAITSNNLAGDLLGVPRDEAQDALMLEAAKAAREFWLKCGTWENEERAEYLLVQVHNALKQPEQALLHAARGLEVIAANGEEVVDEAFIHLAMANAFKLQDRRDLYDTALARANELAEDFKDESLTAWFKEERGKVEWA